jgi:hypothetical protein
MRDDVMVIDASGSGAPPEVRPPTPEEEAQNAADVAESEARAAQAQTAAQTAAFTQYEDAERLRIINERARTDPAYAALAEIVLRGT